MAGMVGTMHVNADRMRAACRGPSGRDGRGGLPGKEGHALPRGARRGGASGARVRQAGLPAGRAAHRGVPRGEPLFGNDITGALDIDGIVAARTTEGGTAPSAVAEQLQVRAHVAGGGRGARRGPGPRGPHGRGGVAAGGGARGGGLRAWVRVRTRTRARPRTGERHGCERGRAGARLLSDTAVRSGALSTAGPDPSAAAGEAWPQTGARLSPVASPRVNFSVMISRRNSNRSAPKCTLAEQDAWRTCAWGKMAPALVQCRGLAGGSSHRAPSSIPVERGRNARYRADVYHDQARRRARPQDRPDYRPHRALRPHHREDGEVRAR